MAGTAENVRIYKLAGWRRWLAVLLLVFVCLMFAICWGIGLFVQRGLTILAIAGFDLLLIGIGSMVLSAFMTAVILGAGRIELRGLRGSKTLLFDQILGLRRTSHAAPSEVDAPPISHFKIEPKDDQLPLIEFDDVYGFDEPFHQWLRGLPELSPAGKLKNRT